MTRRGEEGAELGIVWFLLILGFHFFIGNDQNNRIEIVFVLLFSEAKK